MIRDLSTKAASDGMGDEMERFARGEKLRLSDQRQNYKERIQEIWRRQISALTSDTGVYDTARGGGSEDNEQKEVEVDIDDSDFDLDDDDEDEDNFYKSLASEIVDERKAKGVMQAAGGNSAGGLRREDNHETSTEDAMVLMQWKRQREEERKAQERLESARGEGNPTKSGELSHDPGRKVIRRKITKTFADGQQKTTFKFIVLPKEVEKIKAQKKKDQQAADAKLDKKNEKLSKSKHHKSTQKKHSHIYARDETKRVGHAMFEDEDDVKRSDRGSKKTNITLQVRQNTRVITTKTTKKKSRSSLLDSPKAPPKSSSKKSKDQKLKEKQRKEKKLQRRRKELDEADLYSIASQKRGTSNRRERGAARERMPHVMLSQRFEAIRSEVEGRPSSGPFHRPVNRMEIPQYYEIVSNPIDLLTIRDKNSRYVFLFRRIGFQIFCRNITNSHFSVFLSNEIPFYSSYEYRTIEAFLKDFKLMQNNAIRFNGKDSILGEEATDIYEFVSETIEGNREEFEALEVAVKEQLSGSHRKKKKGSQPKESNADEQSIGTTTNVMLDGFQTTVNLGDINAHFSDSD